MSATKVYDIPIINNAPFERYVIIAAPAANSNRTNPNEILQSRRPAQVLESKSTCEGVTV
jgi:hypothetical protein